MITNELDESNAHRYLPCKALSNVSCKEIAPMGRAPLREYLVHICIFLNEPECLLTCTIHGDYEYVFRADTGNGSFDIT